MNPLRGDVVLVGLLLSVPVLAMGLRGDFSAEEVAVRVLWCLAADWWLTTAGRRSPATVAEISRRCAAATSAGRVPAT